MTEGPAITIEIWASSHGSPPDHKGQAVTRGSVWVRVVIGSEVGEWLPSNRRSTRGTLDALLSGDVIG